MPCKVLIHVHGRDTLVDRWLPGDIIMVRPVNWKWQNKESRIFQTAILPFWNEVEAVKYQGRRRGIVDIDGIHDSPSDRAKMRNKDVKSPAPKALKQSHFQKGPDWGKPRDYFT